MPLTQENTQLLNDFVRCVFNQWYGLQAALQHGMGGDPAQTKSKLNNMIAQISYSCSRPDICEEELSDELEDTTDSYFDVIFEDGSVGQVAHELWSVTRDLLAGNKDRILMFVNKNVTLPAPIVPTSSQPTEDEMETGNDDDVQKSECSNVPDDEGWEVPRYGRRKR